jgi:hypothetical protein
METTRRLTKEEVKAFNDAIDNSLLEHVVSFGTYRGKKLKDIPEDYILWYTRK